MIPVKNTTFELGAVVRMKELGDWHYYQITEANTSWHGGVCMDTVPKGAPIYSCVWKDHGTRLEVRATTYKKTAATKTVAQWEAEQKARYDENLAAQAEMRMQYDKDIKVLTGLANADSFDAAVLALLAGKI